VTHGAGHSDDELEVLLEAPYRPGAADASSYAALVREVLAATASGRSARERQPS